MAHLRVGTWRECDRAASIYIYIYIVVRKSEEKRRGGGEKLRVVSVEGARTAVKKELVCARRRGEKKVVCVQTCFGTE